MSLARFKVVRFKIIIIARPDHQVRFCKQAVRCQKSSCYNHPRHPDTSNAVLSRQKAVDHLNGFFARVETDLVLLQSPGSQNITKIYHEEIRVPANIKIAIPCRTKK